MVRRCGYEWPADDEDHARHVCERPIDHDRSEASVHACAHCPEVTR